MDQRSLSPQTLAAQGLGEADPATGGLAPVISLSTNYEQQPDGSHPQGRAYTRADNPTSEHAEQVLAALEGGGCACALFSSGMAAATAVFQSPPPPLGALDQRGVPLTLADLLVIPAGERVRAGAEDLQPAGASRRGGRSRGVGKSSF